MCTIHESFTRNPITKNTSFLTNITKSSDERILKISCVKMETHNPLEILDCVCKSIGICDNVYCPFGEEIMIATDQLKCMDTNLDSVYEMNHTTNSVFYLENINFFFVSLVRNYSNMKSVRVDLSKNKFRVTSNLFMGINEKENTSEVILLTNLTIKNECFHRYLQFQKNIGKYPGSWKHMSMCFKSANAFCMTILFFLYVTIKEYRGTFIGKFVICHIVANLFQYILYIVKVLNKQLLEKNIYEMLFVGFEYSKFLWIVIIAFHTYKVVSLV